MKTHTLKTFTAPVLCSLLLICGGCSHFHDWMETGTVGPRYTPPRAEVATNWINHNNPYTIASQHGIEDCQWWQVFADPELDALVQSANCNYLPLALASLQILESQHQRAIAKGNLFPQQQGVLADYRRLQFSENGNQIGIAGLGNSFDLFRAGFNASWEVDLWGRLRKQVEAADAQVGVSVEDWHDVRLSLTADVVTTYLQIRLLQQRILIARQQVEAQQETLRIAKERVRIGTESRLDETQASATVAATEASIPQLQSALQQANNRLCILLGVPPRALFNEQNTAMIPEAPRAVIVGLPRDLLRRRPDVRRAERAVASQNALIGVAAADLFPQFTLSGQFDWQAFKFRDVFDGGSFGGALAPGFTWQILNYGRIKNNIELERNRLEQAVVRYRQTVLDANREAEDAAVGFAKKQEEVVALSRAVDATRESLEVANVAYRVGDIDLDRVNNLRKDLIEQLDLLTLAQGEAAIALVSLYRSMGGGWTPNVSFCQVSHQLVNLPQPPNSTTVSILEERANYLPVPATPPAGTVTPQFVVDHVAWSQAGPMQLEKDALEPIWSRAGSLYDNATGHQWGMRSAERPTQAFVHSYSVEPTRVVEGSSIAKRGIPAQVVSHGSSTYQEPSAQSEPPLDPPLAPLGLPDAWESERPITPSLPLGSTLHGGALPQSHATSSIPTEFDFPESQVQPTSEALGFSPMHSSPSAPSYEFP